jgi:hypothetical protein
VRCEDGAIEIAVRRDRNSSFEPQIVAKRCYGASGEDKASSSLETTDGVPHAAVE